MARRMLFEFVDEQPGADLLQVPRTVAMSLILVERTIAALAEAMQIRVANEPAADRVGHVDATYGQTLCGLGQITAQPASGQVSNPQEVMFPLALLRRAARYISNAADLVENGGRTPRRSSRDSTLCARRSSTPRRRRSDRAHHHGLKARQSWTSRRSLRRAAYPWS
jgi:hypothetical protein